MNRVNEFNRQARAASATTTRLSRGSCALVACFLLAAYVMAYESVSFLSAAEPASGLSDADIDRLRQNATARCRAAFESESGKPFVSREIRKDWNNRGDFTRNYIQDAIHFATRALTLVEQIDEANVAVRDMCQFT